MTTEQKRQHVADLFRAMWNRHGGRFAEFARKTLEGRGDDRLDQMSAELTELLAA